MEKIAVISDIHGNLPALEAVLDDIRSRGIRRIICLGDLVGKGPEPVEVVRKIRETCETVVQGNWDHGISRPQTKPAGIWQRERLDASTLDYLLSLPFSMDVRLGGRLIRLFHASASSVYHRVMRKAPKAEKLALFDNTEATGTPEDGSSPDVVVYGDIHVAYHQVVYRKHKLKSSGADRVPRRYREGLLLVNTGSAGLPYDGIPQASYVILEGRAEEAPETGGPDRSTPNRTAPDPTANPSSFGFQFVRVPYDIEQAIRKAEQWELPNLERYTYELRTATEW